MTGQDRRNRHCLLLGNFLKLDQRWALNRHMSAHELLHSLFRLRRPSLPFLHSLPPTYHLPPTTSSCQHLFSLHTYLQTYIHTYSQLTAVNIRPRIRSSSHAIPKPFRFSHPSIHHPTNLSFSCTPSHSPTHVEAPQSSLMLYACVWAYTKAACCAAPLFLPCNALPGVCLVFAWLVWIYVTVPSTYTQPFSPPVDEKPGQARHDSSPFS
ncbi:hypothetical protein BKA65DRAFT_513230 [Rhexocercosporidium sp. MPI-PUGE-AT-0058]|nr:hypothetical protein BKA65DRAFT_513230 [Rhexocercosporidium sp. MPI-PUGE-AT-0058]